MNEKTFCYQFDDVRVDHGTFQVRRGGEPLLLEPKAFEALVFLINHRGRLVEKTELLDAVWKDTFVTLNALTRVIARLRRALGDDARDAKMGTKNFLLWRISVSPETGSPIAAR